VVRIPLRQVNEGALNWHFSREGAHPQAVRAAVAARFTSRSVLIWRVLGPCLCPRTAGSARPDAAEGEPEQPRGEGALVGAGRDEGRPDAHARLLRDGLERGAGPLARERLGRDL